MFRGAKKSLGQNFLKSAVTLQKIVASADITSSDTVLEIGPGKGALTKHLLNTGAHIVAIEKDTELIPVLQERFAAEITAGRLTLIEGDILQMNLTEVHALLEGYKVVANIPYYITGAIIEFLLTNNLQPQAATLLVQKEVAERIVARDHKESILSISIKAYAEPKYIMTVGKKQFSPAPKVDSAVVQLTNISKKKFTGTKVSEERFFEVVKAGFAHKRKQLGNNLDSVITEDRWTQCSITKQARAENLSVDDWFCLAKEV